MVGSAPSALHAESSGTAAAAGEAGEAAAELAQRQELAPGGRRDIAPAISMPHLGLLPLAARQEVK